MRTAESGRGVVRLNAVSSCGHPILWAVDSQNRRVAELSVAPEFYDSAVRHLWQLLNEVDPVAAGRPRLQLIRGDASRQKAATP